MVYLEKIYIISNVVLMLYCIKFVINIKLWLHFIVCGVCVYVCVCVYIYIYIYVCIYIYIYTHALQEAYVNHYYWKWLQIYYSGFIYFYFYWHLPPYQQAFFIYMCMFMCMYNIYIIHADKVESASRSRNDEFWASSHWSEKMAVPLWMCWGQLLWRCCTTVPSILAVQ